MPPRTQRPSAPRLSARNRSGQWPPPRRFAALAAGLGWFALGLQFYLSVRLGLANGDGLLGGVVAYVSYFTILTNILAAIALTAAALPGQSALAFYRRPGTVTTIAASILVVGSVYGLILRHLWQPQGWQWLADGLLHYAMPPLFVAHWWWGVPKAQLRPRAILRWIRYPLGYAGYALVLGALRGRYPLPVYRRAGPGVPPRLGQYSRVNGGVCPALPGADRPGPPRSPPLGWG